MKTTFLGLHSSSGNSPTVSGDLLCKGQRVGCLTFDYYTPVFQLCLLRSNNEMIKHISHFGNASGGSQAEVNASLQHSAGRALVKQGSVT